MAPVLRTLLLTIASALVQSATSAHLNKTVYAVTVSSQVTGGSAETLCAQIHGPTERVVLTVSLELESGSSVLLEEAVTQDFYRCQTFQVPVVSASTVATVNVTVRGESESMSKKTKVLINPPSFIRLIQTDKPIYKPGQTVRFRIVSLDSSFIPLNQMYKTVELQDPNRNRIAQWLDRAAGGGILDLSHAMSPEAAQGTYTITAWTDEGETMEHNFDIKAYVLPKYEVTVNLPKVITILDQEATVTVCAKYTYGKPVLGVVKAEVCRRVRRWFREELEKDICKKTELTTDKAGCATYTLNITEFAPRKNVYMDTFEVEAEMEEHGTGVVLEARGRSSFTNRMRTVTFVDVADAYKPGIAFEGMVKVTGPDSKPLAGELVHLEVNAGLDNVSLTTNRKGLASFSLDTSLWKEWVSLQARFVKEELQAPPQGRVPTYGNDYKRVVPFYSKSRSFLKLMQRSHRFSCKEDAAVHAKYIIQGGELKKEQEVLDFFYTVMSRGEIVQHGRLSVAIKAGIVNKGEFSIPLRRLTDLAPYAQLVVYTVMPGGEAVADSQNFPIQLCLKNKVSLKFSSLQELPGEKTTLNLQAQPGSLCSVRAIDQSVLLLQTEKELSVDSVYSQLPVEKMSGYSYQVEDFDPYPCFNLLAEPAMEVDPRFRRRRSYIYLPREKSDVYSIFKEIGMKIVTNSDVKKPYDCHEREIELLEEEYDDAGFEFDESSVMDDVQSVAFSPKKDSNKKDKSQTTVRSYFPETWIWDLVPVGDSGTASIDKTVPDTITKWAAGAFCTSPVGFGLSPNAALTAFQPFFVSLTLPYSVVRGEVFTLKATVFNYLSKCIMVKASLELSKDYTFRECDGCQYRLCLCGEESKTFRWIVTPASLGVVSLKVTAEALKTEELCGNEVATIPEKGRIDTVVRDLLVEAEGSPEAVSHNALLCPTEGPVEKSISLLLPEMFVAGSAKAFVSVLGDLMGRAMKNLDKLLAMPYGCGEQNMVLFAPNIYILNYLSSTGQLTQDIQDRATRFLESGYQRELNYKHDDGSYSAFGKSDNSGNTWLTSFVMKSFGGARPYIFVDPGHIAEARKWLGSHQRSDGCINSVGKLFHNGMKGGVSDDVSLTAYITAALLELDGNATAPEVERSLRCLKLAVAGQLDNMYTTALLAYTFTLAGDEETRAKLITYMHQKAIIEGGMRHWARAEASAKRLDSLEVEMTAYVLLALLSGPPVPGFHLDYSSDIVRWLAQQQNPYGGFASTQDTVVALQALAKYGTATYRADGASTVVVTSLGGFRQDFTVDQSNRLLYQEEQLPEVPGEYKVSARGQGCVLTQIALRYNIPPPADFSTFHITANTAAKCNGTAPQLLVSVGVRYQGRRAETNMVIINIKLLSGFVLDESSLMLLNTERSVKRVDVEEGYVNIYLDSLKKDETKTYSWTMAEEVPVRNLKPAVVKVYDYYQTSDEAITDYSSPCAESDDANEF